MREDLFKDLLPQHGGDIDPVAMARRDQTKVLPKRFYKTASVRSETGGFALVLDGKPARTPAGKGLILPTQALGEAVAAEWAAVGQHIDPATMPLTRIANSALDGVAAEMAAVAADVHRYAGSDLVCYRAGDPQALVAMQAAAWDPVLAFAHETFGARFILSEGVVFVEQPAASLAAIKTAVDAIQSPFELAALHVMTTLMGSVLLALAVMHGRMEAATAWSAAHVDEDFQMQSWGSDDEALARRERRWRDMEAAGTIAALASKP
jgi:chaperone required for assembly of F1-ATPase